MLLLGHHLHGYLEMSIMGREFPDGMTEHALAFGFAAVALVLMLYGLYAMVRDFLRWRSRAAARKA